MAVFKCKMCGGDMELNAEKTFGTCEYCGSAMTLPKLSDEQRLAAFNRGNHFRRVGEFDKALAVYERIVQEDDTDAEAHWCCALCRFGIEYVEDPATYEWLPTCHRASFDSFLEDVDYKAALEYSDGITRRQYMKDAAKIAEVQRGILATSQNAEPYDVFICYKETDENGQRTRDSLLAQDIYYQLTEQGRRVFFARITLEDVAGSQYEPYIFAALNSAKVMVAVGTKPEHFNAVWVKNEWSRFLAMMKKDHSKLLLPCYRDMDPYDLPEQLSVLQSYDMSKIGFIQDLIRGVGKVLDAEKKATPTVAPTETVVVQQQSSNVTALLKRGAMALEDGEWSKADEFFEEVLNQDAECAEAYLGKLMAELKVRKRDELRDCVEPFDNFNNYKKTLRFADEALKQTLCGCIEHINARNEEARLNGIYERAKNTMTAATTEFTYKEAAKLFDSIPDYKDAAALVTKCYELAEIARKDSILNKAKEDMARGAISNYKFAIKQLDSIPGWKDADEQKAICQKKIEEINAAEEASRVKAAQKAKQNKKITAVVLVVLLLVAAAYFAYTHILVPAKAYKEAEALYAAGKYAEAAMLYSRASNYKDAKEKSLAFWEELGEKGNWATISAGDSHTVGLKSDGTVVATGNNKYYQCDVKYWTDIVAVSAGDSHTVGLKSDGTVVATGYNKYGQCDVKNWTDIVAVGAGFQHTVGLKSDGTVVATGSNWHGECDVEGWTDIVAIAVGDDQTLGLKADSTAVFAGIGFIHVTDWTDIVAANAGFRHAVGLKADGTVVASGSDIMDNGCKNVTDWTDIVAISAGGKCTVGLKSDGTVVAVGNNYYDQCNVTDWTDIVAISAGGDYTVGLKSDGTVVAVGSNAYGRCDVAGWTDIRLPNT